MVQSARVGGAGGLLSVSTGSAEGKLRSSRSTEKPRIVLIDPRPLTRESVVNLLTNAAREFGVVPVSSVDEVPDEVLAKARLVVFNVGFALLSQRWVSDEIRMIGSRMPEVPLIVLCDSDDINQVTGALARGVRGYIPTTFSPRVAVEAMRLVHAGGTFIPASALKQCGNGHHPAENPAPGLAEPATQAEGNDGGAGQAELLRVLTPRQKEVLRLLCEGKPNKIIAHALKMQEGTVKVHVRQIMKKLNATNRTQVAFLANRLYAERNDDV
jgi:DNA-binding NarL/FixJ family response regulator